MEQSFSAPNISQNLNENCYLEICLQINFPFTLTELYSILSSDLIVNIISEKNYSVKVSFGEKVRKFNI